MPSRGIIYIFSHCYLAAPARARARSSHPKVPNSIFSLSLSLSLSPSLPLSLSLPPCLSPSLSLSVSLPLFLCLSLPLSLSQPAVLNWKAASDQLVDEGEGEVGRGLGGLGFPLNRRRRRRWRYRSSSCVGNRRISNRDSVIRDRGSGSMNPNSKSLVKGSNLKRFKSWHDDKI